MKNAKTIATAIQKSMKFEQAVRDSKPYKEACKYTRQGAIGAYDLMQSGLYKTQVQLIKAMGLDKDKDKDLISRMVKLGEILKDITDAQLATVGASVLDLKVLVHKDYKIVSKNTAGKKGEAKAKAIAQSREEAKATRKARPNGQVIKTVNTEKLTELFCNFVLEGKFEEVEKSVKQVLASLELRKKNEKATKVA